MSKKRIDQIIFDHFPELSRSKIQTLIQKEKISIRLKEGTKLLKKPSEKFDDESFLKEDILIESDEEIQYVSRGALKLKNALQNFSLSVSSKICLDVGLSTGGFSEVLLEAGAQKVLGIDVGTDQLHSRLREHPKLKYYDKVNARNPIDHQILSDFFGDLPPFFDLIVVDVSFISLSLVIPNLLPLLAKNGCLVCLVKPQFELSRGDLNNKGVVKDPDRAQQALEKIIGVLSENGIKHILQCDSPIEGDNGNKEFLVAAHIAAQFDS